MSVLAAEICTLDVQHAAPELCELFETVFGHPIEQHQWQWKYAQAPSLGHTHVVAICPISGRLLGHAGAVVFAGTYARQPLRMAQVSDVMVHPDARSDLGPDNLYRRIMQKMQQTMLVQGPSDWPLYAYGFPGVRPARLGERIGLYRRMYMCTQYNVTPNPVRWWQRYIPERLHARKVESEAWSTERLNYLWEKNQPDALIPALHKSAAYLQWRYQQHPLRPYTLWILQYCNKDWGWLITRQDPVPTVVDTCLPQSKYPWTLSLERGIAALIQASGCERWTTWLPHAQAVREQTPIVAVEMLANEFHPHWRAPIFQPGDTDVF